MYLLLGVLVYVGEKIITKYDNRLIYFYTKRFHKTRKIQALQGKDKQQTSSNKSLKEVNKITNKQLATEE